MVYGGMIGGNSYNFEDEDGGFLGMVDSMEDEEEEERVTNGPNDGSSSSSAPSSPNKDKVAVQERATMTWRLNKSGKKSESADEMDDCVYFLTLSDKGDKWEWSKPDTKLGEKGPVPTNTEGLVSLGSPSLSPSLSSSMGNKGVGKGTRPSARTEHGMAKVDTNLVALFGGWTNSTYTRICADIHVQEAIHFYFYFTSILLLHCTSIPFTYTYTFASNEKTNKRLVSIDNNHTHTHTHTLIHQFTTHNPNTHSIVTNLSSFIFHL